MNTIKSYLSARPWSVTIAAIFVLCITAWNGLRAYTTLLDWEVLSHFYATPLYILVMSLVWLIAGLGLYIIISNGGPFALRSGLFFSMIYIAWYWFDRLFIQVTPAGNSMFSAVVSIVTLAVFNMLLFWPSARAFFTRVEEA